MPATAERRRDDDAETDARRRARRASSSPSRDQADGAADAERAEARHLQLEDRAAPRPNTISSRPAVFTGRI